VTTEEIFAHCHVGLAEVAHNRRYRRRGHGQSAIHVVASVPQRVRTALSIP
jgi:hypothetical protein